MSGGGGGSTSALSQRKGTDKLLWFEGVCCGSSSRPLGIAKTKELNLDDAFIQSDLQLIRISRKHTPWSNVGLRALLKVPTAVQILSWPDQGSNHRPCAPKSCSLTTMLQAACHRIDLDVTILLAGTVFNIIFDWNHFIWLIQHDTSELKEISTI